VKVVPIIVATLSFVFAPPASAHRMAFHPSLAHRSLRGRAAGQRLIIQHDRRILRRTAWLDRVGPTARHRLYWATWRDRLYSAAELRWTTRNLRVTLAAIRAASAPAVNHLAGWLCIHSREGSWTDEGAPYYGGLQMSYGWMGVVTDAARLSPSQQIALADSVASKHGYRYDWMQHQWPNTFPPCAGYFG